MQIWIYLNGIQQGPYTLDQLRTMGIDPATPVWYEGLDKWTPASQAPATASLWVSEFSQQQHTNAEFREVAPQNASNPEPEVTKPPTFLVWNILLTVICCNLFGLIGIITGVLSSSRFASGDYQGAKKFSEATEWLLILAIVWLVVGFPVMLAFSLF